MNAAEDRGVPFPEVERQTAELDALRRAMVASRGTFSLSIAICNSPALRDYLVGRSVSEPYGVHVVSLPGNTQDVHAVVREQTAQVSPSAIFILCLENSVPSYGADASGSPTLRLLNAGRESWARSFSCPVVFWVPEYVATFLSIHARDFWAWRSHQFEFQAEQPAPGPEGMASFSGGFLLAANLDADRKRFRIAELEQRIGEAGDPPPSALAPHVSAWLNELAFLFHVVGDLDQAEAMFRKSLAINEKLGRLKCIASDHGNLGVIYETRGDLQQAEAMHRKSLAINEKLGCLEGMAINYGNLGLIYKTRGDLDQAEAMHRNSLAINENLGWLEGMASQYGNLGVLYEMRGDLDQAEAMSRKGLEIAKKLGHLEYTASSYGSLGLIYRTRGDLDQAEAMYKKSLEIHEKLGRLEGMANQYGNLGNVYLTRGDLDQAEAMHKKALAISEKLGRLEGMANQYGNLGLIYETRGDLDTAREYWTKARDLFARIGIPHMVDKVQGLLDDQPSEEP